MEEKKQDILKFMEQRPETIAIIGYGSGINPQLGQEKRKMQIDLIIVVSNLKKWHTENMKKNPKDYSLSSKIFFKLFSNKTLKSGAKICYMTYLPFEGKEYKIGTIEEQDFLSDLNNYDTFYLAGRMQKPILIVKTNEKINQAIEYNRKCAVLATKLLLGPGKYEEEYFYTMLTGLSYIGDTRMGIAENPNKVKNIVKGSYEFYQKTYRPLLQIEKDEILIKKENYKGLPKNLKIYLDNYKGRTGNGVRAFLVNKNKSQSTSQTIKGIFTTGPIKAIKYACAKLKRKQEK